MNFVRLLFTAWSIMDLSLTSASEVSSPNPTQQVSSHDSDRNVEWFDDPSCLKTFMSLPFESTTVKLRPIATSTLNSLEIGNLANITRLLYGLCPARGAGWDCRLQVRDAMSKGPLLAGEDVAFIKRSSQRVVGGEDVLWHVMLPKQGESIAWDVFGSKWREAYSVAINMVDRRWAPLNALSARMMRKLGFCMYGNMYLSPVSNGPPAQGFAAHMDSMAVVVVQVAGSKEWSLHSKSSLHLPMDGNQIVNQLSARNPHPRGWTASAVSSGLRLGATASVAKETEQLGFPARRHRTYRAWDRETATGSIRRTTLRPGDVLYIPSGMVHEARVPSPLSRASQGTATSMRSFPVPSMCQDRAEPLGNEDKKGPDTPRGTDTDHVPSIHVTFGIEGAATIATVVDNVCAAVGVLLSATVPPEGLSSNVDSVSFFTSACQCAVTAVVDYDFIMARVKLRHDVHDVDTASSQADAPHKRKKLAQAQIDHFRYIHLINTSSPGPFSSLIRRMLIPVLEFDAATIATLLEGGASSANTSHSVLGSQIRSSTISAISSAVIEVFRMYPTLPDVIPMAARIDAMADSFRTEESETAGIGVRPQSCVQLVSTVRNHQCDVVFSTSSDPALSQLESDSLRSCNAIIDFYGWGMLHFADAALNETLLRTASATAVANTARSAGRCARAVERGESMSRRRLLEVDVLLQSGNFLKNLFEADTGAADGNMKRSRPISSDGEL